MKNNLWNRFIYNLGLARGPKKWGWFVIPNFIWNSGLAKKYPKVYAKAKELFYETNDQR